MTDDIQDVILLSHFISSDASWHHHPIGHKTRLLTVHKVIVRYTDHLQVLKVTSASLVTGPQQQHHCPQHKPHGRHYQTHSHVTKSGNREHSPVHLLLLVPQWRRNPFRVVPVSAPRLSYVPEEEGEYHQAIDRLSIGVQLLTCVPTSSW